jgi:thiol-disulfide isomerase/thioredoxin
MAGSLKEKPHSSSPSPATALSVNIQSKNNILPTMTLHELSNPQALSSFLSTHPHSLICFSATWCGPCKASKPQLEALAASYAAADSTIHVACGIVYEHVLQQEIHTYQIKAFPTYVLFRGSNELGRITGVNFDGIKSLVSQHCKANVFDGEGKSLGGGGGAAASAADARAQRLARFGAMGGGAGNATGSVDTEKKAEQHDVPDEEMKETAATTADIATKTEDDTKMDVEEAEENADSVSKEQVEMVDPTESLKQEDIVALTDSMGFSLIRAQKGLLNSNGTVEGAVEWLLEHQEDDDIDDPIEKVPKASSGGGIVAQSYKCNDCGKILSNMANLELHANKTGHSDFEESTELKKPLTAEEKEAKIQEIKSLLKAKRAEREDKEKVDNVEREKQRRFMGKEMAKTREQMEIEERKRIAQQHKREKDNAIRERQRIRAELEKDKLERMANKGKLSSRLGVDGYHPDAIQYDAPGDAHKQEGAAAPAVKKVAPSVAKMDEYITKVSSYRAGGDGGNCLKILKAYIGNVVKHPDDPKYRKINMENNAYRTKVKPFLGAKSLLLCVGFAPTTDGTALELAENADMAVLKQAEEKVDAAFQKYTK